MTATQIKCDADFDTYRESVAEMHSDYYRGCVRCRQSHDLERFASCGHYCIYAMIDCGSLKQDAVTGYLIGDCPKCGRRQAFD